MFGLVGGWLWPMEAAGMGGLWRWFPGRICWLRPGKNGAFPWADLPCCMGPPWPEFAIGICWLDGSAPEVRKWINYLQFVTLHYKRQEIDIPGGKYSRFSARIYWCNFYLLSSWSQSGVVGPAFELSTIIGGIDPTKHCEELHYAIPVHVRVLAADSAVKLTSPDLWSVICWEAPESSITQDFDWEGIILTASKRILAKIRSLHFSSQRQSSVISMVP